MSRWFQDEHDPLARELQRIEHERKRLRKQEKLLEQGRSRPAPVTEKEITRLARFKLDSPSRATHQPKRLRVQERRIRNRFFFLLAVLAVLGLILSRLIPNW
ncbi:MAG: hypothetical protein ACFCUX_00430 [Candidatus Methylacidiphilales bacterium]